MDPDLNPAGPDGSDTDSVKDATSPTTTTSAMVPVPAGASSLLPLSPLATPMPFPLSPLPSHPSASLWCAFKTVSCALNGVFVFASSASPALAVMTPLGSVKVYPVVVGCAGYVRCLMKHTTIESSVYLLVM